MLLLDWLFLSGIVICKHYSESGFAQILRPELELMLKIDTLGRFVSLVRV